MNKTELITIPREEYDTMVEALEIMHDKKLLKELQERETQILSGKFQNLKDL
ncbi:MAG: hypothetical protein Q7S92_03150 [Candidatus Diapherotrites archaeon]|nr:hypothetical protein [Candidatus Diapherotrites archaeon]